MTFRKADYSTTARNYRLSYRANEHKLFIYKVLLPNYAGFVEIASLKLPSATHRFPDEKLHFRFFQVIMTGEKCRSRRYPKVTST